jgi:hypothetical protein
MLILIVRKLSAYGKKIFKTLDYRKPKLRNSYGNFTLIN